MKQFRILVIVLSMLVFVGRVSGETPLERADRLVELAKKRFPDDWPTGNEPTALVKLLRQTALGEVADYGDGEPAKADKWGKERVLQSDHIEWLCTDREAIEEVTHRGVRIKGARIEGVLGLSYAKIGFPLAIVDCAIPHGVALQCCQLYALFLDGTHTGPINADGLRVERGLHMRRGFHATGDVRLLGATIGGNLSCANGHFSNKGKTALNADRIDVKGSVFLNNVFDAEGQVSLLSATIGGSLICNKGHFSNKGKIALNADRIDVKGGVFLGDEFKAEGEVRLLGAKIAGDLNCINGYFSNRDGDALSADGIDVQGNIFLRNEFKAEGQVRLFGAKIGGNLNCINGYFSNRNCVALTANNIEVGGSVFLCNQFRAEGDVDFSAATVARYFQWWGVEDSDQCTLRLESAKIGTLWYEEETWPAKLYLDGLVYDRLASAAPVSSDARLGWLKRQGYDKHKFIPQPYMQLAKVLQEMGHEHDARRILIAKQADPARVAALTPLRRLWNHVLGLTIGYGYQPWLAGWWIVGFILLGTVLFRKGSDSTRFQKTIEGTPPIFHAFVYSLDSFVPLIDLHQAKYRLPTGRWLRVYLWFHIGFGWLLTTLLVVGLTGLVRK